MKKYFLFLIIISTTFYSCNDKRKNRISDDAKYAGLSDSLRQIKEQADKDYAMKNATNIQLIDSVYNFGSIAEGEKVSFNYRFKNTGKNPLTVFNATASCGCTIPEKPEAPIAPGETGFIKVVFNSSGKHGHNEKEITVNANVLPEFPVLKLIGEVVEK